MKITYTGRQVDFPPAQLEKIQGQFAKLAKLLDRRGEREAHIVLSHERHLHHAEVTVNYQNHALVGLASDVDAFAAVHAAVGKLEKQALKVREKWRDGHRPGDAKEALASRVETEGAEGEPSGETDSTEV